MYSAFKCAPRKHRYIVHCRWWSPVICKKHSFKAEPSRCMKNSSSFAPFLALSLLSWLWPSYIERITGSISHQKIQREQPSPWCPIICWVLSCTGWLIQSRWPWQRAIVEDMYCAHCGCSYFWFLWHPQIPHQSNGKDSGIYTMHIVKCFLREVPKVQSLLKFWFPKPEVMSNRQKICDLIYTLQLKAKGKLS
jgi:hypothetical protein